jgi:tetratricopeptide (TPR) repeat protein
MMFIVLCLLQLLISGCLGAVTRNRAVNPVSRSATAPLPFSDYMRTIYRISEEGAGESEEQRQKLLQSNADFSQLAACAAADAANTECRIKLAEAYVREGFLFSAYTLFNEVVKLNGDDFRTSLGLAQIWDQWKDYSMAQRFAEVAAAADPRSAFAHELLGNIQLHLNAPAQAFTEFKKSLELEPGNAVVTANLGYAQMLLHNWPEAKAAFEKALSIDSSLKETRNNLGIVLAQMGDYDGAVAQMQQVSGPAVAYNNLGVVLLIFKKEPAAAAQAFEQALRYDPSYEKARDNLGAARALLPLATFVNLPARQGAKPVGGLESDGEPFDPHPALRATLSQRERDNLEAVPLPLGEGGAKRRVRVEGLSITPFSRPQSPVPPKSIVPAVPPVLPTPVDQDHPTIYGLLAIFGLILATAVASRCLLPRN